MVSLVSSSVNASACVTTYSAKKEFAKNATVDDAINIGNLDQASAIITVSDEASAASSSVSVTFTAQLGYASLAEVYDNVVTQATTTFQLMDSEGTVIASNAYEATDAQKTAFQNWLDGKLQIDAGTYTATAVAGNGYNISINKQERQGTTLQVTGELTGSDATEFYNFSLAGTNIKLDFATKSNMTRVVLYNENGAVAADSQGNSFQRSQYALLTSNVGLAAKSGNYLIEVTYAKNADTTKPVDYSFQLYSGNSYAVIYKNTVTAHAYDNTAAGNMEASYDALLFEHTDYNKIVTGPDKAVNIGWLQQDKCMLDVVSMLTAADNTNYYSFVMQRGDNLKFGFNTRTTKDPSKFRVQLLDSSGLRVIADNFGTKAQKELYEQLTTKNGMQTKTGTYLVKVSYAAGVARSDAAYEFGIYSGTKYSAQYKTFASPQTYANAILRNELGFSTNRSAAIAAYLTTWHNSEEDTNLTAIGLMDALKSKY